MIPFEIQVQNSIRSWLATHDINPYSVIFVSSGDGQSIPVLRLTFWLDSELQEFKDLLGYKTLVDRSGYHEFPETRTVLLSGLVLLGLFRLTGGEV